VLQEIYAARELLSGTEAGNDFAEAAGGLMEALAVLDGPVAAAACADGRERLELLRRAMAGVCYYADPEPVDAIEAQGWLELPWNDAPLLVLTGFNEGFVPDSVVGHAFLPDATRAALDILQILNCLAECDAVSGRLLSAPPEQQFLIDRINRYLYANLGKTLDIEEAKKKPAKDNASSGGDTTGGNTSGEQTGGTGSAGNGDTGDGLE
jgi:hypothetical protein